MTADMSGLVDAKRIAERFAAQRARLEQAARRAGRDPAGIQLIAVSKTQPPEALRAAYAVGQRDFGENYVQELTAKAQALSDLPDVRFHLIGHLQRNKARSVVGVVSAVHTVDSVRLAQELGKRAAVTQVPSEKQWPGAGRFAGERPPEGALPVLVEVNVGREPGKSGCAPEELDEVLDAVAAQRSLILRGLMTVPPWTEDPDGARPFFEELNALRNARGGPERLPELSMGMSHDAEVAIACGATCVRIGTALFGSRRTASSS